MMSGKRIAGYVFTMLASEAFLVWLAGLWMLFYAISFIWMKEAFAFFAEGLRSTAFIQFPFLLFLLSAILNLLRFARSALRRGVAYCAVRTALPAGMIIFFAGFFISLATRDSQWITVGEGHELKPRWGTQSFTVVRIDPGIRDVMTDAGDDAASRLFQYEPRIYLQSGSREIAQVGAFPPAKSAGTYFHILDFGLAPGVRFAKDGKMIEEGYMPMKLLAPGSVDNFEIRPYPYRFTLSLAPSRTVQRAGGAVREYDLKSPRYDVRVYNGSDMIAESKATNRVDFEGFTAYLEDPTYWFKLDIVRDPGIPVVLAGIAIMLAGGILIIAATFLKISRWVTSRGGTTIS